MRIVHYFLYLALLCLLPILTLAQKSTDTPKRPPSNIRLVLMGLVVSNDNQEPIDSVTITLLEQDTQEKQQTQTREDGCFQFRLLSDVNYQVFAAYKGIIFDEKTISTVHKTELEIIHTMFETKH